MKPPRCRRSAPSSTEYGRPTTSPARSPCSRRLRWRFLPRRSGMARPTRSVSPTARSAPPMCRWANLPLGGDTSNAALNVVEEALAISDETGERWAVAEVLRIKAGLLQSAGRAAADEIENLLVKSLETARRQQALSWQLRTACDLVRLRQEQGRGKEALRLLQSIYGRFTEGFGTADLIQAEALLESLRPRGRA